ncbi:MAG: Hsp20/alpha crystallin family protein [Candidatus Absconditabacterales bacterium]|jgi:HSP20 family molecular chaperone IbpA
MADVKDVPHIPYDIYESPQEIVIILPLGGVKKESIKLEIKDYRLVITGKRIKPQFKENLISLKEECYWGSITQVIDLPPQVYFDKIHSKLTPDNTLEIIVPKALVPEKISLEVEYDK